jgi:type I restriction enzyme S subunit
VRFATYPHTKPSGVEWLGQVPEHWVVKAIKWESPVLRGASPRPIDNPIYFDDEGRYAWVRISDVTAAGMYLTATEQKLSELGSSLSVKLEPGALFLSIAGSVGKPCITRIKCCIHDGFVFFPQFKGDAKFLYYLFASGEPYRGLGKLGTQLNLNTDTVGSIVAGFPSTAEQQEIAEFLDRETGRVDLLLGKKRELIERLQEKRTALISSTVTRGLPPAVARAAGLPESLTFKPSGLDWLGDIPTHWKATPLKHVVATPITDGPHTTPDFVPEGIPFVSAEAVWGGRLHLEAIRGFISPEDHAEYSRKYAPQKGDIYVVKSGSTTGKIAINDLVQDFNIWSPLAAIRCDKKLAYSRFVFFALSSDYFQGLVQVSWSFGTQPNIGMEVLENLPVILPPIPEQAAIAAYLDKETEKLDGLVTTVEQAIERLQEYRTALITSSVTGKIDVRGANE